MYSALIFEPRREKTYKLHVEQQSLINGFVVCYLGSIITKAAVCQNSWFLRLSTEANFCLT